MFLHKLSKRCLTLGTLRIGALTCNEDSNLLPGIINDCQVNKVKKHETVLEYVLEYVLDAVLVWKAT